MKRSKLLIQTTTWMVFKGIIQSEKSQSQKVIYKMILDLKRKQINSYRENIGVHQGFEVGRGSDYNVIA